MCTGRIGCCVCAYKCACAESMLVIFFQSLILVCGCEVRYGICYDTQKRITCGGENDFGEIPTFPTPPLKVLYKNVISCHFILVRGGGSCTPTVVINDVHNTVRCKRASLPEDSLYLLLFVIVGRKGVRVRVHDLSITV